MYILSFLLIKIELEWNFNFVKYKNMFKFIFIIFIKLSSNELLVNDLKLNIEQFDFIVSHNQVHNTILSLYILIK